MAVLTIKMCCLCYCLWKNVHLSSYLCKFNVIPLIPSPSFPFISSYPIIVLVIMWVENNCDTSFVVNSVDVNHHIVTISVSSWYAMLKRVSLLQDYLKTINDISIGCVCKGPFPCWLLDHAYNFLTFCLT